LTRVAIFACALVACLFSSGAARAHDPFEVTAIVNVRADAVVVATTMARATALRLATGDRSPRATFPPERFAEHRPRFAALAPSLFELRSGTRVLRGRSGGASLTGEGDVEFVVTLEPHTAGRLTLRATHLGVLSEGYTSAVTLRVEGRTSAWFKLMTAAEPDLSTELVAPGVASTRPPTVVETESHAEHVERFGLLGVEHVLTGYDHLLFLLGVLAGCRTVRGMLALVTCFTVAHSITLALATLGRLSAPAAVVEPLIAASILFVGVENLHRDPRLTRRMLVTFAFGLIHGMGFASVLGELEVPRAALASTLLAFNVGVELGQLAIAALALPLLLRMHGSERGAAGLRYASVLLSLVGCFWLCERLLGA
jgi:hydrogenase/urease accessory protein HupE